MKQSLLLNYTEPRLRYQQGKEFSLSTWRKRVLVRDRYRCKNCKNTISDCYRRKAVRLEAHHIVPRRHGGRNTLQNGVTLCNFCHNYLEHVYSRYGVDFKELAKKKSRFERVEEAKKILKYTYLGYLRKMIKYY